MSLSICQICGQCLCNSDLSSDPLQHFCIGLDGPAMVNSHDFLPKSLDSDSEHEEDSRIVKKKTITPTKPAALSVHNPDDLEEIDRLQKEIEELRRMKGRTAEAVKTTAVKA
ncbi:hypothetical protein M409DRAFT_30006 [Zasmidium cellare ATCC 36951]|uniref:Uncharacterized protein n=1 Tax=Zasmidium cellare ATCC 36951 TaxID=1080233 RepID=A0A6A6BXL4_ZASCE|nr:uncharacterized protein M409DRAFT_30006 [Zasmidium cellare ATCC 36951]KAF2159531.1 hypothetical protein M409DRAFT_30006 [Zasmidium cellare ATCC 36951]